MTKPHHNDEPKANKTDAGNGSKTICRVSNVLRSPSPDPRRSHKSPCSMFKLHAQHASASESGDYFQVLFEESDGVEDGRYFLIQRQFEFPDGGRCAIETESPEMCGHFRVPRASLERGRFQITWMGRGEWLRMLPGNL